MFYLLPCLFCSEKSQQFYELSPSKTTSEAYVSSEHLWEHSLGSCSIFDCSLNDIISSSSNHLTENTSSVTTVKKILSSHEATQNLIQSLFEEIAYLHRISKDKVIFHGSLDAENVLFKVYEERQTCRVILRLPNGGQQLDRDDPATERLLQEDIAAAGVVAFLMMTRGELPHLQPYR